MLHEGNQEGNCYQLKHCERYKNGVSSFILNLEKIISLEGKGKC